MYQLTQSKARNVYRRQIDKGLRLCEKSLQNGGWKEYFEGRLAIQDEELRGKTAIVLENAKRALNAQIREATLATSVGGFKDYVFPIIRAMFPTNVAHELVSVQPMTSSQGLIFYMNLIIGTNKGSYVKGDRLFDAVTGFKGGYGYGSEQIDTESAGTTAGSASPTVSGTFINRPVRRNTLVIDIADTTPIKVRDDGNGGFTKISGTPAINAGSINYETGAWSITFDANLGTSKAITSTYYTDFEVSGQLPEVDIQLVATTIESKKRAYKYKHSMDAAQDFAVEFGGDLSATLVETISQLLRAETAREVIHDLWEAAGAATTTFDISVPTGSPVTQTQHFKDLLYKVNIVDSAMYDATQRGAATWITCDPNAAAVIKSIGAPVFVPITTPLGTIGPRIIGTLNGKTVIEDPHLKNESGASSYGNMLLGYKGPEVWDSGYVHSVYQPLYFTNDITLEDMITRKAFMTRYGKKLVNANYYKKITFTQS